MRCEEIRARLEEMTGEELAAAERGELARHLAACPGCQEALRLLRQTSAWVELSREEPPAPGPGFWSRLEAALGARRAEPEFAWSPVDLYARAFSYALAGLVLALGLSLAWLETPAAPEAMAVVEFDSLQASVERLAPTTTDGQVDRDQVMLTLVSEPERNP